MPFVFVAAAALAWASSHTRYPGLLEYRPWPSVAAIVLGVVALLVAARALGRSRRRAGLALLVLAAAAIGPASWNEIAQWRARRLVESLPAETIRPLARHVIVGWRETPEIEHLITRIGVAGVFVNRHNVRSSTPEAVAAEIARLQALRASHGLPPLIVATDQEGGLVAAMSPPLPRPPAVARLAADPEALKRESGRTARALACLGITVNFAPVVDIDHGLRDPGDRLSRIGERSIGRDPARVEAVAGDICVAMAAAGLACTLKHFPGLGPVVGDTHVSSPRIASPGAVDLAPFRGLARHESRPWVMLGHVVVDSLDPARPASAAPAALSILRRDLGFAGVAVTDDVTMAAFAGDLAGNAVSSLAAGVDLLLVAYDPALVWPVLAALAAARDAGRLDPAMLRESAARLEAGTPPPATCPRAPAAAIETPSLTRHGRAPTFGAGRG